MKMKKHEFKAINVVNTALLVLSVVQFLRNVDLGTLRRRTTTTNRAVEFPREALPVGSNNKFRILYIVTSLSEYDTGARSTTQGYDRFTNTLLPVVQQAVTTMRDANFSVDVYLITHYNVTQERRDQLQSVLQPLDAGIEIWQDATPVGYSIEHSTTLTRNITRGLARQHRYVIKDKFLFYDFFCSFEDDMLITGQQVQHFLTVSNELYQLRTMAPSTNKKLTSKDDALQEYHGIMTSQQIERMLPGFIRVETPVADFSPKSTDKSSSIPINLKWNDQQESVALNYSVCCRRFIDNQYEPEPKTSFLWETGIEAVGIRKLPPGTSLDWALLLAGNQESAVDSIHKVIGDYWTGLYFNSAPSSRPDPIQGKYLNNQGGWMATRRQLVEWHTKVCPGAFLPPYNQPEFPFDGLDRRPVEYWSGGIQIFGIKSCNMKRIIPLDPERFVHHLLFHTANNKQKSSSTKSRMVATCDFWGQLNEVKIKAEQEMTLNS